jgi:DNA-binding beta-propeller fold protein YncE
LAVVGGIGSSLNLSQPQEAVVGPDGRIYVADTGNHRVAIVDRSGRLAGSITQGPDGPLRDPFSLAFTRAGMLLVLDSDAGSVYEYTTAGKYVRSTPASVLLAGARGIAVSPQGQVLVVHPPTSSVFVLNSDLTLNHIQPGLVGGLRVFGQPSAVSVGPDGSIYVVDSDGSRVVQFSADWRIVHTWPIVIPDTQHSPHLLVLNRHGVLMTDPQNGRLLFYRVGADLPTGYPLPGGVPAEPLGISSDGHGHVWVTCNRANQLLEVDIPGT